MKIIDLTHTFDSNMPVYPGDPKSTLEQVAYIEKDTFNDHKLTTVMHVGTHMDAPLHMIDGGRKMSEMEPEKFFGPGIVIDVSGKSKIDSSVINNLNIKPELIVLLYSGYGSKYRTDKYFEGYPELTEDFANKMVELKVKIVGMDFLGPDLDKPWTTHKILLGNEILILENLTNLDKLLRVNDLEIFAFPLKLEADAAPARVFARIK